MNIKIDDYKLKIDNTNQLSQLEGLRVKYLGRNGLLNKLFQDIANQAPQDRKQYGQDLNQLKADIESLIEQKSTNLIPNKTPSKKHSTPNNLYRSHKFGHLHPITITERQINSIFQDLGFSIYDGPEIETDEFCFERLNLPKDHPARELQDSIYIKEPEILLRTQTSSVESRLLASKKPPFRTAFPGRVYRNEKVNKSNHFVFHHYQAVVVDTDITMKDLFGTMDLMFKTLYGQDVITRFRCKYYPEVEPGVGPDMQCFSCHGAGCPLCKGAGWIEMGGAGMIHPNVLQMAGIDPKKWRGFAFGMGLDRWTMAKFNIKDIRTLLGGNLAYLPTQA